MNVRRKARLTALVIIATLASSVCSDPPLEPRNDEELTIDQIGEIAGLLGTLSRGLRDTQQLAFVSVEPGSLPEGSEVVVKNRDGVESRAPTLEGGIDPLSVPATTGDLVEVSVVDGADGSVVEVSMIPVYFMPPIVVRTEPPRRRTSVPLNPLFIIVFSEPIDPASVTDQTILLRSNRGLHPLALSMRQGGTTVEARPLTALLGSTDYELEIGTGIRDLTAEHLQATETVEFQTVPCDLSGDYVVRLFPDTVSLPVGTYSGFLVAVDSGARVINEFPNAELIWATTDPTVVTVDEGGGVGGASIGEAYVTVEYKGAIDSALVIVTKYPPPGPFAIFPGAATVPIGFELQFDVSHPEGTERPDVSWASSDPTVFVVDASGLVSATGEGLAYVVATTDAEVDSAEIEVYDPSPPDAELFSINPAELLIEEGDLRQLQISGPSWPPPPVEWASSDPQVASVDQNGLLQGLSPGTAEVSATYPDGSTSYASVQVAPDGTLGTITLVPQSITAAVGDTVRFELIYDSVAAELYQGENTGWSTSSYEVQVVRYLAPGVFEAINAGVADIGAHVGPLIARAVVTVTP